MSNVIKSKRFVVRQSLVGKNQVIEFTNKKGDTYKYNHDKVYSILKKHLATLPVLKSINLIPLLIIFLPLFAEKNYYSTLYQVKSRSWTRLTTINKVNGQ